MYNADVFVMQDIPFITFRETEQTPTSDFNQGSHPSNTSKSIKLHPPPTNHC
jgi:hypothetical protein